VASLPALCTNNDDDETSYHVSTVQNYEEEGSDNTYSIFKLTAWMQKPGSGETMSMRRDCECTLSHVSSGANVLRSTDCNC
jgi:hypothetical protein